MRAGFPAIQIWAQQVGALIVFMGLLKPIVQRKSNMVWRPYLKMRLFFILEHRAGIYGLPAANLLPAPKPDSVVQVRNVVVEVL